MHVHKIAKLSGTMRIRLIGYRPARESSEKHYRKHRIYRLKYFLMWIIMD